MIDDMAAREAAKRQREAKATAEIPEVVKSQAIEVLAKFDDLFKESIVFLGSSANAISREDLGDLAGLFNKGSINEVDTKGIKRIFKSLLTKTLEDYIYDMKYGKDSPSSLKDKYELLGRTSGEVGYFKFLHNVVREMAKRLKEDGKKELADALVKKSKDAVKGVKPRYSLRARRILSKSRTTRGIE